MKTIDSVHVWINKTLVIISLGLSIWALIIASADYPLFFDEDKVITFAGLLFTVIGTVFALYFVIIGIDAKRKKDKIKELDEEIDKKQLQIERFGRMEANQLDTMYGHLIEQTNYIKDSKERIRVMISLRRDRARLATQSIFLPKERRQQRMSELSEIIEGVFLGEKSDIIDLERIIKDPSEDQDIIKVATEVKKQIENNCKQN